MATELDKFKDNLNENSTVVAHSLGTLFILIYLRKNNLKISSLISIAAGYNPAYLNDPTYKDFVPSEQDFEYCKENIKRTAKIRRPYVIIKLAYSKPRRER